MLGTKSGAMWSILKAVVGNVATLRAVRWRRPSETRDQRSCVIMDLDIDLKPGALNSLGAALLVMRKFDPRIETDHPIFIYLGERSEAGLDSEITLTLSIRRRQDQGG